MGFQKLLARTLTPRERRELVVADEKATVPGASPVGYWRSRIIQLSLKQRPGARPGIVERKRRVDILFFVDAGCCCSTG